MEYDIRNDTFIDYGADFLNTTLNNTAGEEGTGVYYTQINHTTLYTISRYGEHINVYDLQSLSYGQLATSIPINVDYAACIASSELPIPRLYITGGGDVHSEMLDDLQILNLDDLQWLTSLPSMTTPRWQHACIVRNDKLWAFGGAIKTTGYTVEVINTTNIEAETWEVIGSFGSCDSIGKVAVSAVQDLIYIVGGVTWCGWLFSLTDSVYVIDTVTNSISLHADNLTFVEWSLAAVEVDYTIYVFGSSDWATLDLLRTLCTCSLLISDSATK